jgi:hypothetical protein
MFTHILTSPLLLAECLLGLLAAYVLGTVAYRLTLHPLARYPGPFPAKITDLYLAYHAWKGDRHLEFHRCHEKYGIPLPHISPFLRTNMAKDPSFGWAHTSSPSTRPRP